MSAYLVRIFLVGWRSGWHEIQRMSMTEIGRRVSMFFKICFGSLVFLFMGCAAGTYDTPTANHKMFSGAPAPDRVYIPKYYVYKKGRYTFVKGHYRRVLFPARHWKRSLLGGSKNEYVFK